MNRPGAHSLAQHSRERRVCPPRASTTRKSSLALLLLRDAGGITAVLKLRRYLKPCRFLKKCHKNFFNVNKRVYCDKQIINVTKLRVNLRQSVSVHCFQTVLSFYVPESISVTFRRRNIASIRGAHQAAVYSHYIHGAIPL